MFFVSMDTCGGCHCCLLRPLCCRSMYCPPIHIRAPSIGMLLYSGLFYVGHWFVHPTLFVHHLSGCNCTEAYSSFQLVVLVVDPRSFSILMWVCWVTYFSIYEEACFVFIFSLQSMVIGPFPSSTVYAGDAIVYCIFYVVIFVYQFMVWY